MAGLKHPSQYPPENKEEQTRIVIDPRVPKGQMISYGDAIHCHKDDAPALKETVEEYYQEKFNREATELLWSLSIEVKH